VISTKIAWNCRLKALGNSEATHGHD